jgi:RNA polymerase sigma-70 factor, ECF subfamily
MTDKKYENFTKLDDEALAKRSQKGDDGAFEELVHRYTAAIFNFVRLYTKNKEDAEDITQDSFFKTWKHIRQFEKNRTFRPWLYAIARNTSLDFLKKKRSMVFSELDDVENDLQFSETLTDVEPLPEEIFDRARGTEELRIVMKDLHPDHQAVLVMHYHQEMTFDEIAKVTNKPMNTVKSWHRRALIRMKKRLLHHSHNESRTHYNNHE